MAKVLRWPGYLLAALLLIVLSAAAWVWIASSRALSVAPDPQPSRLERPTPAQLADAPRQLRVLGCVGCHGERLQGDLFLNIPGIVKLHAPNLTLVAARSTDQQLDQGIRQGIGHDGRPLLVMPSEGYQFLSDSETAALIAAIRAMPRGGRDQPPAVVEGRGRIGLALGKLRPAPALVGEYRASPLASFGSNFERGRHIVQVNCSECHGASLTGKELKPGTFAPDLSIAGAYDLAQFETMLRTGIAPGNKNIGVMGEVARSDFKYLKDDEIAAIHAYLVERAKGAP